jgi:tetratricopeptide (TPR) repeat protein
MGSGSSTRSTRSNCRQGAALYGCPAHGVVTSSSAASSGLSARGGSWVDDQLKTLPREMGASKEVLAVVTDISEVRIFVAMPGTTMGEKANWNEIEQIKQHLLEPVAKQLRQRLNRKATLVIEKDKTSTGTIHRSMFSEAMDADVYIADLTGANANVYLELGVRWALKDRVTIPICQDLTEVKFNVSASRVIPYGPKPAELKEAIHDITEAAVEGLRGTTKVDSPVRDGLPLVQVSRSEWDGLHAEIERLKQQQAEDLVEAAKKATSSDRRIELLRQAVERNPASATAYLELGVALRQEARYPEAAQMLEEAVRLRDDMAVGWRELGVTYSKSGDVERAARAFGRAVALDERDGEAWATLGGLQRRRARGGSPGSFDWELLQEAREAYQKAGQLSGNDTYPLMNVARIDLLLSKVQPDKRPAALGQLRKLEHLARFAAEDASGTDDHPWKLFDLADTLLLTGRADEGLEVVQQAIQLINPKKRRDFLTSVMQPLQDFLASDVLDPETAAGVRRVIDECTAAIAAADGGAA